MQSNWGLRHGNTGGNAPGVEQTMNKEHSLQHSILIDSGSLGKMRKKEDEFKSNFSFSMRKQQDTYQTINQEKMGLTASRMNSVPDTDRSISSQSRSVIIGHQTLAQKDPKEMKRELLSSSIKMDTARASHNIYKNLKSTFQDSYRAPSEYQMTAGDDEP